MDRKYYSERFVFDHLEKTGGTAFADWLIRNFGAGCVSPHVTGEYFEILASWGGWYSIITGHCYFRADRHRLHPLYKHATLLRAPIDRALSYLQFISDPALSMADPALSRYALHFIEQEGDVSLSARRQSCEQHAILMQGLSNAYVKHFSAYVSGDLSTAHVDSALNLLASYDCIGFSDDTSSFIKQIEQILGFSGSQHIRRVNITGGTLRRQEIATKALISRLTDLNTFDLEFFSRAEAAFRNVSCQLSTQASRHVNTCINVRPATQLDIVVNTTLDTSGSLHILSSPTSVSCNDCFCIHVRLHNRGTSDWPGATAKYPVAAGYRLYNAEGGALADDGLRTPITTDIPSGTTREISINVVAPSNCGSYTIEVTLLQECIMWFTPPNFQSSSFTINVVAPRVTQ